MIFKPKMKGFGKNSCIWPKPPLPYDDLLKSLTASVPCIYCAVHDEHGSELVVVSFVLLTVDADHDETGWATQHGRTVGSLCHSSAILRRVTNIFRSVGPGKRVQRGELNFCSYNTIALKILKKTLVSLQLKSGIC